MSKGAISQEIEWDVSASEAFVNQDSEQRLWGMNVDNSRAHMMCCGHGIPKRYSLIPLVIFSVFSGTSCWFATNAVIKDIAVSLGLGTKVALVQTSTTTAIQTGFITGTFIMSVTSLADRIEPKHIFFCSTSMAGISNALVGVAPNLAWLLVFRCISGACLAGVYPVAMKMVSSWFRNGLGAGLGFILAAQVLGTALPSLFAVVGTSVLPWRSLLYAISVLTFCGGLAIEWLGGNGPYHKTATKFESDAVVRVFTGSQLFRANAFAYFGHAWECYTFWAFLPNMIDCWSKNAGVWYHGSAELALQGLDTNLAIFFIITAGSCSCGLGALVVGRYGSAKIAFGNLLGSCICCWISPVIFIWASRPILLAFLGFWGFCVVGDSPHLSALSARYAPRELIATAMTIVVCFGFSMTVISLEVMGWAIGCIDKRFAFMIVMGPGPLIGLYFLLPLLSSSSVN